MKHLPNLYLITPEPCNKFLYNFEFCLEQGIRLVQLRAKTLSESEYYSYAEQCLKLCENYNAQFGILLDMVGAKDAIFTQEGYSRKFANNYLQKIWTYAGIIGYGKYFSKQKTNPITDDHYYVNKIANIPTIDILHYDRTTSSGFGRYWHTHNDNIDAVDKQTLKAVGQTVTQVIYQFNQGNF